MKTPRAGNWLTILGAETTPWASVTFAGGRHRFTLESGDRWDGWLAALPGTEFAIRGQIVADIEVIERTGPRAVIEMLTIEE